ncbi:uncharacterized protein BDZ83DRAFT_629119 [Colletotrichum acutatum]|uniref:Secreted protein n=1 Tax=Glomerella acutata TaxID=27357 RepID=A0AAD8UFY7_GLOAC|nr:uncharacterized protein BDZ83DRAFT_629119 [Colletotrichum acutatum]KAK1722358.1 hypothetical protein BDZ83DRAFT_629119 [Colletotrichum acutatum]
MRGRLLLLLLLIGPSLPNAPSLRLMKLPCLDLHGYSPGSHSPTLRSTLLPFCQQASSTLYGYSARIPYSDIVAGGIYNEPVTVSFALQRP